MIISEAQAACADEWVRRWADWGLACAPADRGLVEDGIRRCCRLLGFPEPRRVLWLDSPIAAAMASCLLGQTSSPRIRTLAQAPKIVSMRAEPVRDLEVIPRQLDWVQRGLTERISMAGVGPETWRRVKGMVGSRVAGRLVLNADTQEDFLVRRLHGRDPSALDVSGVLDMMRPLRRRVRRELTNLVHGGALRRGTFNMMNWYRYRDGQVCAGWVADVSFLHDVCGVAADRTVWELFEAYRDANAAGPWWGMSGVVIVAERPELTRTTPDGAAVRWRDGTGFYTVDGVQVPPDLVERGWSAARILEEGNAEVRRVAIEQLGWDRFVADAGLALVDGPVPDPGNPQHTLSLYDLPERSFGGRVRLQLCTNASPERDGTVRRFGLFVPDRLGDAVQAAAWTFDLDPEIYRRLQRAT